MSTTYTMLKSGSWGVRSTSPLREGEAVLVSKKSGETKNEVISKVVWSGNGVWLAAIRESAASGATTQRRTLSSRPRGVRTGCSCGSIKDTPRKSDCSSCRFENEDQ